MAAALQVHLIVFVLLLSLGVLQVAATPGPGGTEEPKPVAPLSNYQGWMQDPDSQDDPYLFPEPLPSSFLYSILHSQAAAAIADGLQRQVPSPPKSTNADDDEKEEEEESMQNDVQDSAHNDDDNDGGVVKRVFCNGFTGCGGRHRQVSRRRRLLGKRLIPVLVKRPFCTSFGCFKAKATPQESFPRAVAGGGGGGKEEEEEMRERKRLFCNGWGCRGRKRSLFSPWMTKMNSVADTLR